MGVRALHIPSFFGQISRTCIPLIPVVCIPILKGTTDDVIAGDMFGY